MDKKSVSPQVKDYVLMPLTDQDQAEADSDGDDEGYEGDVVAGDGEPMGTVGKGWDWKGRMRH